MKPYNKRFGRLTVLGEAQDRQRHRVYLVRCDCGTEKTVRQSHVLEGLIQSCGCFRRETSRASLQHQLTHGEAVRSGRSTTYKTWRSMMARCNNPHHIGYPNYGGRGISVCPEWRASYVAFRDHVGERPDGHTIDRINVNGNYEPGNVRWATTSEQMRNRRPFAHHNQHTKVA